MSFDKPSAHKKKKKKERTDWFHFLPLETPGYYKLQHAVCGPGESGLGGTGFRVSVALTTLVGLSIPQYWTWHGGSASGIVPDGK